MISTKHRFAPILKSGLVLSLALGASTAVFAKHGGIERLAEKLNLTNEQVTAIEALRGDGDKDSKRDARRQQREEIRQLIESGQVDAAATLAGNAASERVYKMAEKRTAMAEILTPEQLAQWDALKESRGRGKGKGHHGRRRHDGDQGYQ